MPKDTITAEAPAQEDIEAKRQALLAQLAELPGKPVPEGAKPGSKVGEGLSQEIVPYTSSWFTDVEARKKDLDVNGLPMWPHYQIHKFIPATNEVIRVNGVGFSLHAGIECGLPTPHYAVYKDALEAPRRLEREFAPDPTPNNRPGYISPVHRMGDGPIRRAE